MGTTIYDVAKEAGISIATVSKVLNGTGRISDKTAKKVREVITRLNYEPSTIASALTSKRTFTLGIIVPNIANPFFGEVTRVIEKQAREFGFTTMVCSTYNDKECEINNIKLFLRQQVDGMIIATEQISNEDLTVLNTRNIPIVKFSAYSESATMLGISTDNYKGGQMAAAYLFAHGHHKVWVVGEMERHSEQQRIAGFTRFYEEKGLCIPESSIFHVDTQYEEAMEVIQLLLTEKKLPTAIFVTTDIVAVILINIAKQHNIQVPEDLSIIGFDNTIFAQLYHPQLTTIAQPVTAMGELAVISLIDMIEGKRMSPYQQMIFKPTLIERATVKEMEE